VKDKCGAECETDADCDDGNPYTNDTCNTTTCTCQYTSAEYLRMKEVDVAYSPTVERGRVNVSALVSNEGATISSYTIKFYVKDPKTGAQIPVIDVETGSPTSSKTVTVNEKLLGGTEVVVPWSFIIPSAGEYVVEAKAIYSKHPKNETDTSLKVVPSEERVTASEYPFYLLLALLVLVPAIAYYYNTRKKQKKK